MCVCVCLYVFGENGYPKRSVDRSLHSLESSTVQHSFNALDVLSVGPLHVAHVVILEPGRFKSILNGLTTKGKS